MQGILDIGSTFLETIRDVIPIAVTLFGFQFLVIRRPLPHPRKILIGFAYVLIGITFFLKGLEMALFPIGETMAQAFARKGSVAWLIAFAFALGFGTTIAEPALVAVADEAATIAAHGGVFENSPDARDRYAMGLRVTVALSVGFAIVIGVLRIIRGWPLHYLIVCGYCGIVIMTIFAPEEIIGIAYDSGGVTTSTITVPLVTALGVGLASAIKERNPMVDGFGLIAFASLTPIIFVMAYGMIV